MVGTSRLSTARDDACVNGIKPNICHVRGRRVVRMDPVRGLKSRGGKIVESMAASAMRVRLAIQAWPWLFFLRPFLVRFTIEILINQPAGRHPVTRCGARV